MLLTVVPSLSHAGIIAQYDIFSDPTGSWSLRTFYNGIQVGQTFVPTVDGTVTSVDTTFVGMSSTTLPIMLYITPTFISPPNGLQPDFSNVLSTGTLSASDPQLDGITWAWVNTPMSPALLQAGTTYMLVATAPGTPNNTYAWGKKDSQTSFYPDGAGEMAYTGNPFAEQLWDLPFRVNAADQAETPEPATWVGLGMGLLALGAIRRRLHQ